MEDEDVEEAEEVDDGTDVSDDLLSISLDELAPLPPQETSKVVASSNGMMKVFFIYFPPYWD